LVCVLLVGPLGCKDAQQRCDAGEMAACLELLDNADENLILVGVNNIGRFPTAEGAAKAVSPLTALVERGVPIVSERAAAALGELGVAARDAVPVLERAAASTDDEGLAQAASAALDRIRAAR